jgi:hypothetical protein
LFSAPIEIGPALLMKELNRCILHRRYPEHGLIELALAAFLGVPAKRAANIKYSHKGFDFRRAFKYFRAHSWDVNVISFGPLPIPTWYGNSQVYFWLTKKAFLNSPFFN